MSRRLCVQVSLVWFGVFLSGCGPEHSFAREYATSICTTLEACAPGVVSLTFGDRAECQSSVRQRIRELRLDKNCDFLPDKASACLDALDSMQCNSLLSGDQPDSCDQVYQCDTSSDSLYGGYDTGMY